MLSRQRDVASRVRDLPLAWARGSRGLKHPLKHPGLLVGFCWIQRSHKLCKNQCNEWLVRLRGVYATGIDGSISGDAKLRVKSQVGIRLTCIEEIPK